MLIKFAPFELPRITWVLAPQVLNRFFLITRIRDCFVYISLVLLVAHNLGLRTLRRTAHRTLRLLGGHRITPCTAL